jgi:tetratricopeptide (TPR) repeat protein
LDREFGDFFALQNEITGRIANALNLELVGVEAARPTDQPEALDYIFRGRAAYNKGSSREAFAEAIDQYERALVLDPGSVEVQSLLADALGTRVLERMSDSPAADLVRAEGLIERALATSPLDPLAHLAKGVLRALEIDPRSTDARIGIARILVGRATTGWSSTSFQQEAVQRDIARGEQLLSEAIASDPNAPMAYAVLGLLRRTQGRLTESRIAFEKAITLDPNFEWANIQLGFTLLFLGEPGNAIAQGEKSLRLSPRDPNIFWRYQLLGWCHLVLNQVDEAIDLLIKARTANPRVWHLSYGLAGALALKGDLHGAKAALAESLKLKPEINSLAQFYVWVPWGSKNNAPQYWALEDKTLNEGLRRIGFPENGDLAPSS